MAQIIARNGVTQHHGAKRSFIRSHGVARSAIVWLEAVERIARDECRPTRQRNLMRLARSLLRRSHRMITSPKRGATWDVLAEDVGVSRRTLAYLLAWLREHGFLRTITPGSTPRYRKGTLCGQLNDGRGNEAAVYELTLPASAVSEGVASSDDQEIPWPVETLPYRPASPQLRKAVDNLCTPYAVVTHSAKASITRARAKGSLSTTPVGTWSAAVTPRTKRDMLAACERLRAESPLLRRLSARHLRSIFRPLFQAGATVRDVLWVVDHHVDGRSAWSQPRWLPAWLRWRVREWVDTDDRLRATLPSQVAKAAHDRERSRWLSLKRQFAEAAARKGDHVRGLMLVRAALARA